MTSLDYLPAQMDLRWVQGDDVVFQFKIIGKNYSGATGKAQVRKKRDRSSELIASFTVTVTGSGNDTDIQAYIPSANNTTVGKGYWDLELEDSEGATRTILAGTVEIVPEITT